MARARRCRSRARARGRARAPRAARARRAPRPVSPAMTSGMRASSIRMRVGLVHEGEVVLALHPVTRLAGEPVAQVVEPGLLRGDVRDVRGVGPLPLGDAHPLPHEADGEPEALVDRPHPLGVAAREVVVEGQDVDPAAGQRVEDGGRHRGERLALARLPSRRSGPARGRGRRGPARRTGAARGRGGPPRGRARKPPEAGSRAQPRSAHGSGVSAPAPRGLRRRAG